jgi:hypothetical protein
LVTAHHALTSSLISGYHLAFLTGAGTIAAGIVLAFALLRPRPTRRRLQPAPASATGDTTFATNLDIQREAA